MPAFLLTAPETEPLSLAEAKAYLRVEHDEDDALIDALIAGARGHVEAQTRRALIAQTWRLVRAAWPADGRIAVLPVPLVALAAVRVRDLDGTAHEIDTGTFAIDAAAAPAVLAFPSWAPPAPEKPVGGIEIDIDVGYGGAADAVPEPLRLAIRMLVAHWYERRGITGESAAMLPANVAALIAPYRVLSL